MNVSITHVLIIAVICLNLLKLMRQPVKGVHTYLIAKNVSAIGILVYVGPPMEM